MGLIKEMKKIGFEVFLEEQIMYCKVFADISRAIDLARLPKIGPRTKYINVFFHHFHEYIRNGIMPIHQFSTDDQCTDVWTKLFPQKIS